jgi:LPS-assembly lipoprotein
MRSITPTLVAGTLCAALLSACGFRLQGAPHLPAQFERTYLAVPIDQPLLKRELAEAIEVSGRTPVDSPAGATAEVLVREARSEQRVLSVSAQGRPREYEVVYRVRFEVLASGQRLLAPQTLELRRDYPFDEVDVLAREREAGVLLAAMQRDMARLIQRRLAAVAPPRAKD